MLRIRISCFLIYSLIIAIIAAKKKCLIVNIDNRELNTDLHHNSYAPKTAVLNLDYANHHGYDFLYVQNVVTDLEAETRAKFPNSDIIPPTDNAKDAATAFHVGLKQFRAASWAKLPALWHVTTTIGMDYDYIWYIDSDAAISPLHRDKSIEDQLNLWEEQGSYIKGRSDITNSAFIFFHNHPWRDDMPCAGTFIYQPKLAEPILREWWDYNLPSKNFKHFHEQDALWHMIEAENDSVWNTKYPNIKYQLNTSTYTILKEHQFPSAWQRYEDLWLCHIASYNYILRNPILYQFLKILNLDIPHRFLEKINEIKNKHTMQIKLLDISIKMEKISNNDKNRISKFPIHELKNELQWYDEHVTAKTEPYLPLPVLHEGRLIRKKGEFWLVCNGTKRGFDSYDTFLKLGFHNNLGISLYASETEQIPTGDTITMNELNKDEKVRTILAPYYQPIDDKTITSTILNSNNNSNYMILPLSEEKLKERIEKRKHIYNQNKLDKTSATSSVHKCDSNNTIENLVHSNGTKCILYLVTHDSHSEHLAHKFSSCQESWIQPISINSTVFFESIIYRDIFPLYQKEWENYDYIATATYKTVAKQLHYNKYTQNLDIIYNSLLIAKQGDYDIVPFLRSGSGTMSFSLYFHGKQFRNAWDAILLELGYTIDIIRYYDEMKSFYRNIYIIKPKILKGLMNFMSRAIYIATYNPIIKELLQKDSLYKEGNEETAMKIFHTKYYQLYPFIFERLPSFYLHASGAKICASTDGPCPYNS